MVYIFHGKSQSKMDDNWGYHHFFRKPADGPCIVDLAMKMVMFQVANCKRLPEGSHNPEISWRSFGCMASKYVKVGFHGI